MFVALKAEKFTYSGPIALKKVEEAKFITALKSILKLVKLQSLVAKCCKMRKI